MIAYPHREGLYLNLTNRCPTSCRFCVKRAWKWNYRGWDLRIGRLEPTAAQILNAIEDCFKQRAFQEFVFCGYGECTYRLPVMLEVAFRLGRRFPDARLRLNTIGLGNLIWGRDIVPELCRGLDAVCVSLNTSDPRQWIEMHRPRAPYRKQGFDSVLEFIRRCAQLGLKTTITAVKQDEVDLAAVRRLARGLGADFRLRPPLGNRSTAL
ncbi:MAG: hypothetical protein A3J74_02240 [Elusimicrobia bacterium RIFCSPHIGHO2_02_FULL_57_9]|nr:MAG: hypothetical protein A3J74_02240 [Elusimicrobia bacterium RIFCSPHIGHO2_02_FULL_57_9]